MIIQLQILVQASKDVYLLTRIVILVARDMFWGECVFQVVRYYELKCIGSKIMRRVAKSQKWLMWQITGGGEGSSLRNMTQGCLWNN